jgi:hypothetical protein
MLFVVEYLVHTIPINQESIFGIPENSILTVSFLIGLILTVLGAIMVMKKIHDYIPTPPNPHPNS